jgi:hypothetical protein
LFILGMVELSGSMLQRKGAELAGQEARVPEPNTEEYALFSIAIMIT